MALPLHPAFIGYQEQTQVIWLAQPPLLGSINCSLQEEVIQSQYLGDSLNVIKSKSRLFGFFCKIQSELPSAHWLELLAPPWWFTTLVPELVMPSVTLASSRHTYGT